MSIILKARLKKLLIEKNITQKELAQRTGIKESIISDLANNRRSAINRSYVEKIADALDVTDLNKMFELQKKE